MNRTRQGSSWNLSNPFSNKTIVPDEFRKLSDEVHGMRKMCQATTAALQGILPGLKGNKQDSVYYKAGESLEGTLAKDFKVKSKSPDSPLRDTVSTASSILKEMGELQVTLESGLLASLGADSVLHSMIHKEYSALEADKRAFRQKETDVKTMMSKHHKETLNITKMRSNPDDVPGNHLKECDEKEEKMKEEMENAEKEAEAAKDRMATTIYVLRAKEKDLAVNVLEALKTLRNYSESILTDLDSKLPKLEEEVKNSKRSRVFGEELGVHLGTTKETIALPLRVGVRCLESNLNEEGLFRVGPSLPAFKKLKAFIDNGAAEGSIMEKFTDPHLFTAVMKSYLRELPDPLFSYKLMESWMSANNISNDVKRKDEVDRLLNELPEINKQNIEYLFDFLAKLVAEEATNKMSVMNVIVVVGPNLLWDRESKKPISLDNVCRSLIQQSGDRMRPSARTSAPQKRKTEIRTKIKQNRKVSLGAMEKPSFRTKMSSLIPVGLNEKFHIPVTNKVCDRKIAKRLDETVLFEETEEDDIFKAGQEAEVLEAGHEVTKVQDEEVVSRTLSEKTVAVNTANESLRKTFLASCEERSEPGAGGLVEDSYRKYALDRLGSLAEAACPPKLTQAGLATTTEENNRSRVSSLGIDTALGGLDDVESKESDGKTKHDKLRPMSTQRTLTRPMSQSVLTDSSAATMEGQRRTRSNTETVLGMSVSRFSPQSFRTRKPPKDGQL